VRRKTGNWVKEDGMQAYILKSGENKARDRESEV